MQFMHAFWGVGQMSFVKHALFVGEDAPELEEFDALTVHILNRLSPEQVFITKGIVDHLDHSSAEQFVGGKLGVDATGDEVEVGVSERLSDEVLYEKLHKLDRHIVGLKQYFPETKNPISMIMVEKTESMTNLMDKLSPFKKYIKVAIIVEHSNNELDNPYMLLWRVVNNIDAARDVRLEPFIMVDATNKNELDGFQREWPGDTFCTKEVLEMLQDKGLIDIDNKFIKKFGLLPF